MMTLLPLLIPLLSSLIFVFFSHNIFANTTPALTADVPWKVWQENNEQSVSYRPVTLQDEQLIEIRATAKVKSSLSGFLYFLETVTNTPNWVVNATESKILTQHTTANTTFYIKMTTMWPFKPRVLLLNSQYWQNDDLSLHIKITDITPESVQQKMLANDIDVTEYLQVKVHDAYWQIAPIKDNPAEILIEYVFIADGRGKIPSWLADHVALKSIWKSMRNLKQYLPDEKWQSKPTITGLIEADDR
ncbi:hypothetical protein [Colwellia sp. E2M01]|uniref:hypothetical protein n=1 Tax=Colwellia sp. E2M01 TaxID=2841561 RepID=UPI001C0943A1|nr:hypothetical protein [Colwellia sp. E2M01]MBU2870931.1 hypothetical protein [Colwellia sp. E2M01]